MNKNAASSVPLVFIAGLTVGMSVAFLLFYDSWDPDFLPAPVAVVIFLGATVTALLVAARVRRAIRDVEVAAQWVLPYLQSEWEAENYGVPGPAIEALARSVGEEWSHRKPVDNLDTEPPLLPH